MKIQPLPIFAIALLFVCSHPASAAPPSHYQIVETALDQFVLPRVAKLRLAAAGLSPAVAKACHRGRAKDRAELRAKFREAVVAYAEVDFLRFGPLVAEGRRERLSFWPDPRGFVPRQLRLLVASNDPEKATEVSIAKQSAAVEGLPALELLIFEAENPLAPAASYRCQLAEAIAKNIATLADAVDDDWKRDGGWRDKLLRPGSDNDIYRDAQESAAEIVKALLTGLALVADVQVKPRLDGKVLATGPYAKSKLTGEFYAASVRSLHALYDAINLEAYLDDDGAWVRGWADGTWRIIQAGDGLGGPARGKPRSAAPSLRELFGRITGLRKIVTRELSTAAGLTVGFNELDGD
jgi:predicted lipoprotein